MKHIVIAGGSGFIGSAIVRALKDDFDLTVLDIRPSNEDVTSIEIDLTQPIDLEFDRGVDVVINLAGASIFRRWTKNNKALIRKTRIDVTRNLVHWVHGMKNYPDQFIQASAIGLYGNRGDEVLTPESEAGDGFLAGVVQDWEKEAKKINVPLAVIRQGIVFGKAGYVAVLKKQYKAFVGGPIGKKDHWVSWIHVDDLAKMYKQAIQQEWTGVKHGVAGAVREKDLAKAIGWVLRRPAWLHKPVWMNRILLGQMGVELAYSQKAVAEIDSNLKEVLEKSL